MSRLASAAFSPLIIATSISSLWIAGIGCPSTLNAELPPTDTIELRGGGQLAGKVLRQVETPEGGFVSVQVDDGISVAIEKARVTRVRTADELAKYSQLAEAAGDDPEKHYLLGKWCTANHLSQQRLFHYQRAITLNPEHNLARAALDYVRDERGNWIPYAVQQRNRGLIWAKGGWKFPEVVAKDRFQDEANVKASKWIKQVAQLRSQFLGRGKKQQEAWQEIQGIRDPLAAGAIAGEFEKSRGKNIQPRALRLEWVKLLGRFRNSVSVRSLVLAGIDEPDAVVREAALAELKKYGWDSAIATYVPMLAPKNSSDNVRRALRGLTYFPQSHLAMTYVNALITTHMQVVPQGPGISTGFSDTGSSGFTTGSDNKPKPVRRKNTDALTLLKMIEPDVDYGFNQQAWREYFAAKLTAYRGNLRRDP
ncbi:HEAT repeat domain-containing protein [Planctomycetes bacterium K23_9]|uniref:Uncharacterized protein n=1 Tax=Stieleria marina TaxID=1930275 RepID=A0A517NR68_9BACT|nr:hypothetical protein K239x_15590 [Planctomycetes bacterium K23_9]